MSKEMKGEGYMGMISSNTSAVANLPQGVIQKEYPKCDYTSYNLDDSIKKIDENNRDNVKQVSNHKSKSMY